jgi:hypothetical protein
MQEHTKELLELGEKHGFKGVSASHIDGVGGSRDCENFVYFHYRLAWSAPPPHLARS